MTQQFSVKMYYVSVIIESNSFITSHLQEIQSHYFPVHRRSMDSSKSLAHVSPTIFGCSTRTSHLFSPPGISTSGVAAAVQQQGSNSSSCSGGNRSGSHLWVTCSFLIRSSILPGHSPTPCINSSLLESGFYFPLSKSYPD